MRKVVRSLVVALAAGVALSLIGAPASATDEHRILIWNKQSRQCLDKYGGRPYTFACNRNNENQIWYYEQASRMLYGAFYRTDGSHSGGCYDGFGGRPYMFVCDDTNRYQDWVLDPYEARWGIEGSQIRNVATGLCLDGYGGRPYLQVCQPGNPYQRWYIAGGVSYP